MTNTVDLRVGGLAEELNNLEVVDRSLLFPGDRVRGRLQILGFGLARLGRDLMCGIRHVTLLLLYSSPSIIRPWCFIGIFIPPAFAAAY